MFRNILILFMTTLTSCSFNGPHRPADGARTKLGRVSYEQARPVFAKNCAACHPSRSGPDWLDFSQARNYALNGTLERKVYEEKSMPPPGSPQAAAITDSDRELLAAWAQSGAPEKSVASAPTSTLVSKTELLVQRCIQCHGPQGPTAQAQPKIPRINGQNYGYLVNQLQAFKWRRRIDPTDQMNDIVSDLTDEELEETARYFAAQKGLAPDEAPKTMTIIEQLLFEQGKLLAMKTQLNCVSCHMDPSAADPVLPALAGQSEQYLINQLLYYRKRERQNELMNEFARTLSDRDISALAIYFSFSR